MGYIFPANMNISLIYRHGSGHRSEFIIIANLYAISYTELNGVIFRD